MSIYLVKPPTATQNLANGRNAIVIGGAASAAAARTAAEVLIKADVGSLATWTATALTDVTGESFYVESQIGAVGGSLGSKLTRGGDPA